MSYWLLKSEPSVWSWQQQVKAGAKGTHWDGVRNHLAKQHLMAMKRGDRAFFYHSNEGKEIVGVVEIIGTHVPDPGDASGRFVMVQVSAREALQTPVTLAQVKAEPALQEMALITSARLSVQPVTPAQWRHICRLGGISE